MTTFISREVIIQTAGCHPPVNVYHSVCGWKLPFSILDHIFTQINSSLTMLVHLHMFIHIVTILCTYLSCSFMSSDKIGWEAHWRWIKIKNARILYEDIHEIIRVSDKPANMLKYTICYFLQVKKGWDRLGNFWYAHFIYWLLELQRNVHKLQEGVCCDVVINSPYIE